ncbi:hypothetical protein H2200_013658 [Cladophialophora chaetospira]|uniref:NTF2-like domain-containing protein n=1 Tax=Cladophialophora chaetospira TaxID=386627 RepID=A0AA38TYR5_9EURO|nr:hypothetical protein H2200_013658 [Cladophialophora chaetospira]
MKFSTLIAPFAFASVTVALPVMWPFCLTQGDANDIVGKFITVLQHTNINAANATAQALIGPNFFEKSDSINMLAGKPVGSITTPSKAEYINGVLFAPSLTGITTNKVLVAGCTSILWYWNMAGVGSKQIPVTGFNLIEITPQKQIADMYVEFNNIGWGIDIGFTVTDYTGAQLPTA